MEPQSGIKTWQWVVTAIIIIVLIIIGVLVFNNKSTEPATSMVDQTPTTTPATQTVANRVVMSDQNPGDVVYLSSVQLAAPGWVVIHKDNKGTPGAVIGSMYFPAGTNPGNKITLSQPLLDGGLYYAMLHSDDGDKKFDASKDLPLLDSKGGMIMQSFRASLGASSEIKG